MRTKVVESVPENPLGAGYANAKEWSGRYEGYGYFCTLRCAAAYANATIHNLPAKNRRSYATGDQP